MQPRMFDPESRSAEKELTVAEWNQLATDCLLRSALRDLRAGQPSMSAPSWTIELIREVLRSRRDLAEAENLITELGGWKEYKARKRSNRKRLSPI